MIGNILNAMLGYVSLQNILQKIIQVYTYVCMYVQCGLPGARTDVGSALLPALGVTHTYMARAHVHTSVKRTTCTFQSECRIQFYVYTHVC